MKYCLLFLILFQIESAQAGSNRCEALFKSPWSSKYDNCLPSSVIYSQRDLKATVPSWVVGLQAHGIGYFKPVHSNDKNRLSYNSPSAYNEVAAYRVSELLGFKIVPETVMTTLEIDGEKRLGSLQLFIGGKTASQLEQETRKPQPENNMISLFHQIISNTNKSDGSYVFTNWRQQISNNNAHSFNLENSFDSNIHSPELTAKIRAQVYDVIKKNPPLLKKILTIKQSEIHEALKELLQPEQIQALWKRLTTLKELCKKIIAEQARQPKISHDEKTQDLIRLIQGYEAELAKKLNRDTDILYTSVCYEASAALLSILPENLQSKVIPVGTSFYQDANQHAGYHHFFLMIPNYFSAGKHLYIDPTFQQFASNYVNPKIFVGSIEDLVPFAEARGILEKDSRFVEQYTDLVKPPLPHTSHLNNF